MPIEITHSNSEISIFDKTDRTHYSISTTTPRTPTSHTNTQFLFPVDATTTFDCKQLTTPTLPAVILRDTQGTPLDNIDHKEHKELPHGTYSIELSLSFRIYIQFTGSATISTGVDQFTLTFDTETPVHMGVRSSHDQPAGNITTTEEPRDMLVAASALSSSLKTHAPDKSLPSFRGHPPSISLGENLAIPDDIASPETDITIETPLEYESIYPLLPLAYYLGATLVPGDTPRLLTNTVDKPIGNNTSLETGVKRLLKKVFFLDCVTRTEGIYQVPFKERKQLEQRVDIPVTELYNTSRQLPHPSRLR